MVKNPGPDSLYPYAGSSGWSGTDTSKASADKDDAEGRTLRRHQITMGHLANAGPRGATVKELRDTYPEDHHGRWSAALSRAHKMGYICMLEDQRVGCHVYVLPEWVGDRVTIAPRPRRMSQVVRGELKALAEAGDLDGILEYLDDSLVTAPA
jgi:hypothetical protein